MWTGIAPFYFACLVLGFVFALIGAIFGEIAGHAHFEVGGHAAEIGHGPHVGHEIAGHGHEIAAHGHELHAGPADTDHMPGVSILNTITVSTFTGFFGASGLIAVWGLGLGTWASLAFAMPTAIVIAAGQFTLFVKIFVKAQASSEATLSDVLGCEAEVIASIPGDRVGEITYVIKGSRYTAPAVSADAEAIPRGARVLVVNIRGNTLVVRQN